MHLPKIVKNSSKILCFKRKYNFLRKMTYCNNFILVHFDIILLVNNFKLYL